MPYFGIPIRNGLPIGLGSVAGFGISPFDPSQLFSSGEQGAWYDPSDYSTLFQDAAGTIPVTAVEKAVGLMLDKSKGLVLGPELVTNGTNLTTTTGWTNQSATLSAENGALKVVTTSSNQGASQIIPITSGKRYKISVTVVASGTAYNILMGSAFLQGQLFSTGSQTSSTTYSWHVEGNSSYQILSLYAYGAGTFYFSNISVRELPGNHATSSGTSRPVLRALYNLLQRTEEFDNSSVWSNVSALETWQGTGLQPIVTANYGIAPDGTQTAERIQFNLGGGTTFSDRSGIAALTIFVAAISYTTVIYVKPLDSTTDQQLLASNIGFLASGVIPTSNIEDVGNGWKRITRVYALASASSSASYRLQLVGNVSPQTMDLLVWGADLRPASQATGAIGPTYQRVVTNTLLSGVYDSSGFLPYLAFNGTNSSMSTGSIDFTATDKMTVWAGVRKLSDASYPLVVEYSANANSNNGSFNIIASGAVSGSAGWAYLSRGTVGAQAQIGSGYASPITNVITGIGDISGDSAILRANGTQTGSNTADQGTGNYGNYPLFIGARNSASLFFNGWLTSLIVRGAQSSTAQIEATEAWVNGKTGAF